MIRKKLKSIGLALGFSAAIFAGPLTAIGWEILDSFTYAKKTIGAKTVHVSRANPSHIQFRGWVTQNYLDNDKDGTLDTRVDTFPVGVCRAFVRGTREYSLEENPDMFREAQSMYERL